MSDMLQRLLDWQIAVADMPEGEQEGSYLPFVV
jgi:hypothetical protein